ncbi:uncharacterized protein LOC118647469 [Monomorium pharaonis]|uniref:uncharacterized protein LOC118647469 n=1 Tax=Monomorium pharaonis TaxID=307658 RepID=UPI0017473346|nr:uncharacterized protein LOC118647469 [Monomorium pharaonis]
MAFWNVAGLSNKDKEFWDGLKEWDVMFLLETWADEKGWEKIRDRVPKGYEWGVQKASRKNRKGRAMGGMIVGIRKELGDKGRKIVELGEGLMSVEIKIGRESWRIVGVYIKEEGREGAMQILKQVMESKEGDKKVIIGGDFNARTGREEGGGEELDSEEEENQVRRRSKDSKVDKEGRKLLELIGECGWEILNGRMVGDEEGEYTYVGGKREHIVAEVKSEDRDANKKGKGRVIRGIWDEEGRERFRGIIERGMEEEFEQEVNEEWDGMLGKIKEGVEEKGEEGFKEVEEGVKGEYIERKREFRKICERKKEEENRVWRKDREARNESVWEIVIKDRKKKKRVNEGIGMGEWKEYFMCLLGGVEARVVRGEERIGRESCGSEKEQVISKEEVRRVVNNLKVGKAGGLDGIPNDVWRWGGGRIEEWMVKFLNRIWKGEEWPEKWKKEVVMPIVKKGEGKQADEAYADDLVVIADDEDQMRSMLERLERYLDEKNLVLNAEKSKMMRFRKGGGRESKRSWWWKGIEEVKEYCYLGYVLQKNGGQEAQIKGRVRRAAAVMGQIWRIGKRKLVWTVMGYGVEIWGWKERDSLERLEERYLRWMMGLDWHTPGYMVREEMLRDKLRGKAGRRAWKYEKRLEEGGGSELARKCLEEIKLRDRSGKVGSGWEEERRNFWLDRGGNLEDLDEKKGEDSAEAVFEKERQMQKEERRERILGSEYNKWYKYVKEKGIPEYLRKGTFFLTTTGLPTGVCSLALLRVSSATGPPAGVRSTGLERQRTASTEEAILASSVTRAATISDQH